MILDVGGVPYLRRFVRLDLVHEAANENIDLESRNSTTHRPTKISVNTKRKLSLDEIG
jgi:hypothetical protein